VLLAGLSFAGALAACNDSLDPIFYTLEQEEQLEDAGLPNEITVLEVIRLNDFYVAAAGAVYYRAAAAGTTDWRSIAPPQGGAFANTLAAHGGNLYAGFHSSGAGPLGLWTANGAALPGITWTQIGIPDVLRNAEITMIRAVNGVLFVSTRESTGFKLYNFADTTSPLVTDPENMISDVTHDGTQYWAIAGNKIYHGGSALPPATFAELGTPPAAGKFGGILFTGAPLNTLYVSSGLADNTGRVFASTDSGVTWNAPQERITDDGDEVAFTRMIAVTSGTTDLLVGTHEKGYYTFTSGDLDDSRRSPDFNIADLFDGAVLGFFLDTAATPDQLFAFTAGTGLWRSADYGETWDRE
jgi:hypothetical protein